MIIKLERSGGVTGIPLFTEINSRDLPSSLVIKLKKLMNDKRSHQIPPRQMLKGAADHYIYKISVRDGSNKKVIECNQYTMQNDLELLIKFLEDYSKRV